MVAPMPATAYCSLSRSPPGPCPGNYSSVQFICYFCSSCTCILYYVYLMLLAIGPNKVFLVPDSAVPRRRSAVLTVFRGTTAITDGTTTEPRRSWRCHCGLCRTSTAMAPRLRCDGGRRSAVLKNCRGATAINDGTTAEPRRSWRCYYGKRRNNLLWQTKQARTFDNVIGVHLKFEHGAQAWQQRCTVQRASN